MNKDEPAFPTTSNNYDEYGKITDSFTKGGLTKREYFAAMAMQGMLQNPSIIRPHPQDADLSGQYAQFSKIAIEYADSLLKQLES